MAEESLQLPNEQSIDYHIVTLFERLEALRKDKNEPKLSATLQGGRFNMHAEIRTLEFWRSIISECLASFFYVFIVCGAAAGAGVGASVSSVLLATALASGFAITALTQCFLHVSGAHINPAVTLSLAVIRGISPLRAAMYMTAQCGGGIAGAALLYGVTVPGYQGNLQAAISQSSALAPWERFGVEFILTFIVVLAYLVSTSSYKKLLGTTSITIGAAYSACSFVSMPYLNPARSLGPSFVLNKWDNHWVYWVGPLCGGIISGIIYEFIFNPKRQQKRNKDSDNESSSINSDEDINYDLDLEKPSSMQAKFSTYRAANGTLPASQAAGYCQSLYSAKVDRVESIYGGTRSLYCKSPTLTRANLHRSQSVYAKSNSAVNREVLQPRPGPLVPAQSLYPLRVTQTQNSHVQNQNVQNQLQQRSESIYGLRSSMRQTQPQGPPGQQPPTQQQAQQMAHQLPPPAQMERPQHDNHGFQPIYGSRANPIPNDGGLKYDRDARESRDELVKYSARTAVNRPESMYGLTARRGQSVQSDDSSYGSYHGPPSASVTPPTRSSSTSTNPNFIPQQPNGTIMMPTNYQPGPPPTQQQQQQQQQNQQPPTSSQQQQSERKLSAQQQQQIQQQLNHSGGAYLKQTSQANQPNGPQIQQQQHQGYNLHPIRQN